MRIILISLDPILLKFILAPLEKPLSKNMIFKTFHDTNAIKSTGKVTT